MMALVDMVVAALLVVSGFFGLVGSIGLVKLPDTMTRLHAPTKATTLGVGGVLLASMLAYGFRGQPWGHELLISVFLLITAPVSALFIAKSVIHRSLSPRDLPPTGRPAGWATFERDAESGAAQPTGALQQRE
ncbi:Na+/H+ antiporter subunit G [Paracoccus sp. S-4012]|uniref:Na+/H+ antiporter subunit G n=1 Tax=Paracoccus sp. S-4012 TaxID=2665648 RepID=UPI0012B015C1|nr:Na+/H+ antiporter subunit G [Paracoccus sp. S-4012]MRX51934.1 Na+/H+ antiporter subunit G [Paracoccus sp. S-4012]